MAQADIAERDGDWPPRYRPERRLGKGGGGEVWAVRDRATDRVVALKALAEKASQRELDALVREATVLSGLEGLGVPRVIGFGRLPKSGRAYLVRELVEGETLAEMLARRAPLRACIDALAHVADQLTSLHRAGILHGDVKPANVVIGAQGMATLVDLGLAAPWRDGGARPEGLTLGYAAPEILRGAKLGARAEVYALGATLGEALATATDDVGPTARAALEKVRARAMASDAARRHPSADELAEDLRRALDLPRTELATGADRAWPIMALDDPAAALRAAIDALPPGGKLAIEGAAGSGRSTLLRRIGWSLGVEGRPVAWLEPSLADAADDELRAADGDFALALVDDADALPDALRAALEAARARGLRVVEVACATGDARPFPMPALPADAARALLERAIPSLPAALVDHVLARAEGRPGQLRAIVRALDGRSAVTTGDVDAIMDDAGDTQGTGDPVAKARSLVDRGRFDDAARALDGADASRDNVAILRARICLGKGEANEALAALDAMARQGEGPHAREAALYRARAKLRLGAYADADALAARAMERGASASLRADALAVSGLAASYLGAQDEALARLGDAVTQAKAAGEARVLALALASLAIALQRADRVDDARARYEEALAAAERAGDAGTVATLRLNLGSITHAQGDFARALAHLEAAVDMGRRAGRASTVEQALLNLANLDIYLGRWVRARRSLDELSTRGDALAPTIRAQLLGLRGELAGRTGDARGSRDAFARCAAAYEAMARPADAAEALLEGILVGASVAEPDAAGLARDLARADAWLVGGDAHGTLAALARAEVCRAKGDEAGARSRVDFAVEQARSGGKREWLWRALKTRSRVLATSGQGLAARRDAEEALVVLEEIASRLPRDLREPFWDDPRRRSLREGVAVERRSVHSPGPVSITIGATTRAPPDRLERVLAINREIAGELELPRLLERLTDHAVALARAERGFVILVAADGTLEVSASRDAKGQDPHGAFSRSVAEQVVSSGEPVVSLSARDDARMADYVSVHQLMLQSVACVPIRAPTGRPIGALYVETRLRRGAQFEDELTTLAAFADQAAIAIENARLVDESRRRAAELAEANGQLLAAQKRLEELLGQRTAQLDRTRKDLRGARAVLKGHFGYQGLVGTSAAMRRVYALVDRVKDADVPILITGESGTGKEVVARAIHDASPRGKRPFTGINCGALPKTLLESELFGHVRGAFTGADRDRRGLFRESEGGTVLLDEIGEMPHKMQAGLLRVLQEKMVRPVGGQRELAVDVRVIAATHRDLESMVRAGTFREDLFYRLHVVEVRLPPLRDRLEDLPMLVDHFLGIFAARYKREKKSVSREAVRKLGAFGWPGNVRQLEHVLLSAWVMSDGDEIGPDDLELPSIPRSGEVPRGRPDSSHRAPAATATFADHKDAERDRIVRALTACNWNRVKAAKMSGIPRRTFYRRLKEYGIQ